MFIRGYVRCKALADVSRSHGKRFFFARARFRVFKNAYVRREDKRLLLSRESSDGNFLPFRRRGIFAAAVEIAAIEIDAEQRRKAQIR